MRTTSQSDNPLWEHLSHHWATALLIIASVAVLDPISFVSWIYNTFDVWNVNDDARQQIWLYMKYWDKGLFVDDYISDYILSSMMPKGYSLMMQAVSGFVDPRIASKILSITLYALTMVLTVSAAQRLGGWPIAWCAALLLLGSGAVASYSTGGLTRSFGYPIIALAAFGLVRGQAAYLVAAAVLGSIFYYVSGVISGLVLFTFLLLFPSSWRGLAADWSLRRRLLVVGLTGLVCITVISVSAFGSSDYGPIVGPDGYDSFPEAGPGGRYYPPAGNAFLKTLEWSLAVFSGPDPWSKTIQHWLFANFWIVGVTLSPLLLAGLMPTLARSDVRRLLIFPAVSMLLYQTAILVMPLLYFPSRYVTYSMPIAGALLIPTFLSGGIARITGKSLGTRQVGLLTVATCIVLVGLMSGRGTVNGSIHVPDETKSTYEFIAELPKDALIAGWPSGILDNIPYITGRRAFLTFETHQGFHEKYILETRARMNLIIDAFYAADSGPLRSLRDDYGVTHFVVDEKQFADAPPRYFKPFDDRLALMSAQLARQSFLRTHLETATVHRSGDVAVLDLQRLLSAASRP